MNGSAVSFRQGTHHRLVYGSNARLHALFATSASAKKTENPDELHGPGGLDLLRLLAAEIRRKLSDREASAFEGGFVNILGKKLAQLEEASRNET